MELIDSMESQTAHFIAIALNLPETAALYGIAMVVINGIGTLTL